MLRDRKNSILFTSDFISWTLHTHFCFWIPERKNQRKSVDWQYGVRCSVSKRIKESWTFYHRFLWVCDCTKKWHRQTWRIRNCRYQRSQTQINKIPVKYLERPRWNSKNITLTLKYFLLENSRTSLLLTTYKCRSAIYKKHYTSELALHKSQPSHFSQF